MFQKSRHLFNRHDDSARSHVAGSRRPTEGISTASEDRHPAMRGLKVSPVHGHHCICDRCSDGKRAA